MMRSISWMGHVSLMQKLLQLTLLSTGRKTSLSQPTESWNDISNGLSAIAKFT